MDLNGGSCPGWPEALPAMESIQILSLYVNDFMYSAAFCLFWPHLNKHAPVVQKTVEPSPPLALGSAPRRSALGSVQVFAMRKGAFWYLM